MFLRKKKEEPKPAVENTKMVELKKLEEQLAKMKAEELKSEPETEPVDEEPEEETKPQGKWRAEEVPTQTTKIIVGRNGEQLTDIFEVLVKILNKLEEN